MALVDRLSTPWWSVYVSVTYTPGAVVSTLSEIGSAKERDASAKQKREWSNILAS